MASARVSPATILIVDDHPACRDSWALLCQDLWPEVHCLEVGTLGEAVVLLESRAAIDLVLSDLRLPDSSPRHTVETLAALVPVDIPIILLSGSVLPLEGYDMLRLGADAFVLKGTDAYKMQARIYMAWAQACGRQHRHAAPLIGQS